MGQAGKAGSLGFRGRSLSSKSQEKPTSYFRQIRVRFQCQQSYEDEHIRNAIEDKIGEGKRRCSTDRVMTRLRETSETVISMVCLVMRGNPSGKFLI